MNDVKKKSREKGKRKSPRLDKGIAVFPLPGKKEELVGKICLTRNISAGGICLILRERVPVHSIIPLRLHLQENENPIFAQGKVVWTQDTSIVPGEPVRLYAGIEFIEIEEAARARLDKYLRDYFKSKNSD